MKRHFYISDDLDDLDRIEVELEAGGVHKPQIHVFSKDDTGVETHDHLHNMESVFKNDVVHGTITGAWIGLAIAALILIVTSYSNWTETGGLYGIQEPHRDFKRFAPQLKAGKHVFIVDVDPEQEAGLDRVVRAHPGLLLAGTGKATPGWVVRGQYNIKKFTSDTFP